MEATQALVPTDRSLLRPDQIDEMEGEREALERKMSSPHVQDKAAVNDQLRRVAKQLDEQRPKPFGPTDIDVAVRREAELRDQIRDGMLSQEEMRKCPPGAVDRHRRWEKAKKPLIIEWQNIQRRLHAGDDDREAASIENFRPTTSTMNMDNALIAGKQIFLNPPGSGPVVTFNDEEIAQIRKADPDIAMRLPFLTNEQRAEVKQIMRGFTEEKAA